MNSDTYFKPHIQGFWHWEDGGNVVCWRDGTTIAYREELTVLFDDLQPHNPPEFGALLLIIAASRTTWDESRERLLEDVAANVAANQAMLNNRLRDAIGQLHKICALPTDLRSGMMSLRALSFAVCEGGHSLTSAYVGGAPTEKIFNGLSPEEIEPFEAATSYPNQFLAEVNSAHDLLTRFTAETLERRLRTGLEQLPHLIEEAELEVSETTATDGATPPDVEPQPRTLSRNPRRDLIEELRTQGGLSPIGDIARHLLAFLGVPRTPDQHFQQAAGGVSDIANRGEPDRLLISELAQDNDVLMSRLANNEALYMRREQPPALPTVDRIILLDTTLRVWGVPRVLVLAAALALQAGTEASRKVTLLTSDNGRYREIELNNAGDVTRQLGRLETALDAGDALGELLQQHPDNAEVFLLTHADNLSLPDLNAVIRKECRQGMFAVAVDMDGVQSGTFDLRRFDQRSGWKHLNSSHVALDDLLNDSKQLNKRTPAPHIINRLYDPDYPLILQQKPFPLLLPTHKKIRSTAYSPEFGVVGINNELRLLRWPPHGVGYAQHLVDATPRCEQSWLHILYEECIIYGVFYLQRGREYSLKTLAWTRDGQEMQTAPCELSVQRVDTLTFSEDWAIVVHDDLVSVFSLIDGKVKDKLNLGEVGLECIDRVVHARDPDSRRWKPVRLYFDGWEIGWQLENEEDPERKRIQEQTTAMMLDPSRLSGQRLHKFDELSISDGLLRIHMRSGQRGYESRYALHTFAGPCTFSVKQPAHSRRLPTVQFQQTQGIGTGLWWLRRADFPGGGRAYHDSRGFLHLISPDTSLPQITIGLLRDTTTCVWTSDNLGSGPPAFFDTGVVLDEQRVRDELRSCLASLRC